MKRKRIILLIVLICIMTIVTAVYYGKETKSIETIASYISDEWISFSKEDGFYTESIQVKLKLNLAFPPSAKIYYTLDGSEPTVNSKKYEEPIALDAGEEINITTIRAVAAYKNELSSVYTKTYVLGLTGSNRYTIPMVSISANPDDLYSDERGILVPGAVFKEYVLETGYTGKPNFQIPANYNEGWVRPVNIAMFSPQGECLINQKAGMYVGGNSARDIEQKTLILDADERYDEANPRFEYTFDQRGKTGDKSVLTSYGKIKLRNFGGDYYSSYLRGQLCAELAYDSGLVDTVNIQPVVVYLNNAYYGIAELQPTYSPNYLGNLYGIEDKENIEVYTGDESSLLEALGYSADEEIDISDEGIRSGLEEKFDIDNLIRYHAVEMIINNRDWPLNNVKAWRYTGKADAKNPYTDGRYRFLIFDTDATFSLYPSDDIFDILLYNNNPGELWNFFYELMQHEPYRQKFVNILLDLTTTSCSTEQMLAKAFEINQKMVMELVNLEKETPFTSVKEMLKKRDDEVAFLLHTISIRNDEIREFLRRYFDTHEQAYTLEVDVPEADCCITVNSIDLFNADEPFISTRYRNYPVKLQADIGMGMRFTGWSVNDEIYKDEELIITESMVTADTVRVKLMTEPINGSKPVIDKVSAKGQDDWIELYNPYQNTIHMADFCISNNASNLQKYRCPNIELGSHETVRIYGEESSALNNYQANFSLRAGDNLYLYDSKDSIVIESLSIPQMNNMESYGRFCHTNHYQFFTEE